MASPMMSGMTPLSSRSATFFGDGDNSDDGGGGGFAAAAAAAADNIATRLSESCCVSDDEGARSSSRRAATATAASPIRRTPTRSLSFSVGFTPGKPQNPNRFAYLHYYSSTATDVYRYHSLPAVDFRSCVAPSPYTIPYRAVCLSLYHRVSPRYSSLRATYVECTAAAAACTARGAARLHTYRVPVGIIYTRSLLVIMLRVLYRI